MSCKIISESETRESGVESYSMGMLNIPKLIILRKKMRLTFLLGQDRAILLIVRWQRYGM